MKSSRRSFTDTLSAIAMVVAVGACGGHRPPPKVDLPEVNGTMMVARTLRYIDYKAGTGQAAVVGKCIYTHYTGYLQKTQNKFDSSHDLNADGSPGEPVSFLLGARQVIAGWELGFQGMNAGGQRRIYVPWREAYGEGGRPPAIPRRADLIFDVEIMAIADSLPHARPAASSVAASTPPHTCPTWRAVSGGR